MVAQLKEATVATARRSAVPGLAIEGPGGRQDKLQVMLQLRIRQHAVAEGRHRVEIDLLGDRLLFRLRSRYGLSGQYFCHAF